MRRVAARAGGGDDEPALDEPLAVDALGVVLDDLRLGAGVRAARPSARCGGIARTAWGRASGTTADRGLVLPSTPCVPWHCLQVGALGSFFASSCPCVLAWYCAPISAWHAAQFDLLRERLARAQARRRDPGVALAAGLLRVHRAGERRAVDVERPPVLRGLDVGPLVAAQAVAIGHALVVEDLADLVRLVAVDAGGEDVGLLFPQLALDDLAVHRLDLRVALASRWRRCWRARSTTWGRCAGGSSARCGTTRRWP